MTESRYFPFIPDVIISAAEQFRMKGWKSEDKMDKMEKNIKMVAVDVDGTFVRSDYTYEFQKSNRPDPEICSHSSRRKNVFLL